MNRGYLMPDRQLFHRRDQPLGGPLRRHRAKQQARAGHRSERHRRLKLRTIAAARPLIRIRPGMVEDVFAIGTVLQIERNRPDDAFIRRFQYKTLRLPAGRGAREDPPSSSAFRKA